MKNKLLNFLFAVALLSCFSLAQANSVPFTTGNASFTKLGLETDYPNSDFDKLAITGLSGNVDLANQPFKIADLVFNVGYNAYAPLTKAGTFSVDFGIGGPNGAHGTLTIPYTIEINVSDTLRLGLGHLSLTHDGWLYNITTQAVDFLSVGMSAPSRNADLLANVTVSAVPLPPAIILMLSGMGLLGFVSRRKGQV